MTNLQKKYLILIIFLFPLLTGCPYESQVSLGEKEAATIDSRLTGTWLSLDKKERNKSIIEPIDDNEYLIRHYRESNGKVEITEFNAFIISIGKDMFVNVYEPKMRYTSGGYLIFKIEFMEPGRIKITEIDRYKVPVDIDTRKSLIKYITTPQPGNNIYADSEIWVMENQ